MRVVVAEDQPLFRELIADALTQLGHTVCAQPGTLPELLDAVTEHDPDIVLTDVRMPPNHHDEGVQAALTIRAAHPRTGVLILTQYPDTALAASTLAKSAGRVGFLLKQNIGRLGDVDDALRRIHAGGTVLDPGITQPLLEHSARVASLTPREREILDLVAQGLTNTAIATRTHTQPRTVEHHIGRVLLKLDIDDDPDINRRVLAVLRYLNTTPRTP